MFISSLKSHALPYSKHIQLSAYYYINIILAPMSSLANILSDREIIMSAFHFHYRLCLTPERKVESKPRPFHTHISPDCLHCNRHSSPFKPPCLKLKTIPIVMNPEAMSYKREVVVGQWVNTSLVLSLCFNNDINFNQ